MKFNDGIEFNFHFWFDCLIADCFMRPFISRNLSLLIIDSFFISFILAFLSPFASWAAHSTTILSSHQTNFIHDFINHSIIHCISCLLIIHSSAIINWNWNLWNQIEVEFNLRINSFTLSFFAACLICESELKLSKFEVWVNDWAEGKPQLMELNE